MNIKVLSPEESLAYWNEVREENKGLAPYQIEQWVKSLPKTEDNPLHIVGEENWEKFYKYIYTLEGQEDWQRDLDLITYLENWWKANGETTEV
jgi:hypothetical protein